MSPKKVQNNVIVTLRINVKTAYDFIPAKYCKTNVKMCSRKDAVMSMKKADNDNKTVLGLLPLSRVRV